MGGNFRRCSATASRSSPWSISAPCPGSPLHDAERGLEGIVDGVWRDLLALAGGRLRRRHVRQRERPALRVRGRSRPRPRPWPMSIGRLRREINVPFGVNVLWDPMSVDRAWRRRPAQPSCARSSPAPMPPTWGRGRPMPARRCATATGSAARDLALLYNVSAEFAYSLDQRALPTGRAPRCSPASPTPSWSPARSPARRPR